ncbi:hypothetical protein UFOVP470_44 [uncultured Caudovirales phage]|jgi:hypothetical protein|uniref:Uncharacterized protein n=1 Tax=uncultured Caudovirales phage TaxID=2100421 RepID=A0A6J5MDD2_9CAUD|nr:hypothetical protein UFOVP470_44 [uncultured Caudovirales phage]
MNSHSEINHDLIEALQSTGMLIRLNTSSFGTQATDREKSREVTDNAQASSDAARVVVNRLPGKAKLYHAKLTKTQSLARQIINDMTTPWDESGWRLLLTTRFDELARSLSLVKKDFDAGLTALSANADEVISDAKAALGDLGANVRMPTKEDMINSYSMKTDIVPIPDGAQFRNLPPSTKTLLQHRLDKQIEAAYQRGVESIMERVKPMMTSVVERLDAYDGRLAAQAQGEEVGRTGAFRDTLVYNIAPVAELVGSLAAVTKDARLTELHTKLTQIVQHKPDEIRADDAARQHVKQNAHDALALFDEWDLSRLSA